MTDAVSEHQERFHATSGHVSGWLTIALAAVVGVTGLAYVDDGFPDWVVALAVVVAVLAWASMLRPALWVRDGRVLVMRNMLETVEIRLEAVEELALRQVLAVRAADRRWVSTVVGRTWRKTIRHRGAPAPAGGEVVVPQDKMPYADFVEQRLHQLVADARTAAGVRAGSSEQLALPDAVRRQPARLPIALVAAALLLLLVTLVV